MPRQKQNQQFEPTSLEDILTGRNAFSDIEGVPPTEALSPSVLQVREAGRGFSPEFEGEHNEETRFRLLRNHPSDRSRLIRKKMQELRTLIRERERDGLPPMRDDVLWLERLERQLEEVDQEQLF